MFSAGATGREGGQGGANYRPEGSGSFGEYSVFDCAWRPPPPPPSAAPQSNRCIAGRLRHDLVGLCLTRPQAGPREREVIESGLEPGSMQWHPFTSMPGRQG